MAALLESSLHGAENSIREIHPCSSFVLPESSQQFYLRMEENHREIQRSFARIIALLDEMAEEEEELASNGSSVVEDESLLSDASESSIVDLQTPVDCFHSSEQNFTTLVSDEDSVVRDISPSQEAPLTHFSVEVIATQATDASDVTDDRMLKLLPEISLPDPRDVVLVPPPPLAPPWLQASMSSQMRHRQYSFEIMGSNITNSIYDASNSCLVITKFDSTTRGIHNAFKVFDRLPEQAVVVGPSLEAAESPLVAVQVSATLLPSTEEITSTAIVNEETMISPTRNIVQSFEQGISIEPFSLFENTMTVLGGLQPTHFIAIDNALVFDTTTIIAIASVDLLQAVDPHQIKLMIIVGNSLLIVEFGIRSYCPSNPIAEDVTFVVFLWALCAMCSQIGVGIVYQQTHQIYASWSVSWFKLNAQDFLLFVERPLNITYLWNIVLFQYMNTISTRPQISHSQKIKLSLANVLFSCNTFESLLLGKQGLASLVQNYSAISVECKELSFGYFIGSPFKPYVVAFASTELAKVGDYSWSSTPIVGSFGYLVWINGYVTIGVHKSLILGNFESVWKLFRYMVVGILGMCSLQDNRVVRGGWQELPFTVDVCIRPSLFVQLLPVDLVDAISQRMVSLSYKHQLIDDCVSQSYEITIKTATFDHCGMALVDTFLSKLRGALLLQLTSYSQILILECIEVQKYKVPDLENETTSISQAKLHVPPKMDILKVFYKTSSKIPANSNLITILWKASTFDANIPARVFFLMLIIAKLFELFSKEFMKVKSLVSADWEQMVVEMLDKFETNLIFIDDTTVESRLQNRVSSCFGRLAYMGIQPWVLTGYSMDIILPIGFACSLLTRGIVGNIDETSSDLVGYYAESSSVVLIVASISSIEATHDYAASTCSIVISLLGLVIRGKPWDPGGLLDMTAEAKFSQCKQSDPGKSITKGSLQKLRISSHSLWDGPFVLKATWKISIITQHCYFSFNLEDKVDFKGEGNVMNLAFWRSPIKSKSAQGPQQEEYWVYRIGSEMKRVWNE